MEKQNLIGPGEAAKRLGVSGEFLRRDRHNPDGPRIVGYLRLPNGCIRYRSDEIDALIARGRVEVAQPPIKPAPADPLVQKIVDEHPGVVAHVRALRERGQA